MIPKIIHCCWLSNEPVPENLKRCMDTWKERLPGYEFMLWNFERFHKDSSLWVRQAFDSKKYAFAADYIRLYAVCNYGGIYLDMDIEVLRAFDDLLDAPLMVAYENEEKTGIEAGCFGAEKGNPFIADCLSYYADRSFIKPDGSFDTLTLPKIMKSFLSAHPGIKPMDWHCFTNKSYKTGKIKTTGESYAVHHFAGSWLPIESKIKNIRRYRIYKKFGNTFFSKLCIYINAFFVRIKSEGVSRTFKYYLSKYIKGVNFE